LETDNKKNDNMRRIWIFKIIKNKLFGTHKKKEFISSHYYWEQRYKSNKDSGSGSCGRLAKFKADILNEFVQKNSIQTVIEYGCGDGNQLSLAEYPNYIGFDVSNKALQLCENRFCDDTTKLFYHMDNETQKNTIADLVLSLDVLYHLVEDEVFESYMTRLFSTSRKYVIIYSSNYDELLATHVKCRKFTDWIVGNVSRNWELVKYIKNPYPFDISNPNHTSMADFYIYKKRLD